MRVVKFQPMPEAGLGELLHFSLNGVVAGFFLSILGGEAWNPANPWGGAEGTNRGGLEDEPIIAEYSRSRR